MEKLFKKINTHTFPCLICGVDSYPIRVFLTVFFGSLALGSLCVFLWAKATGRLKSTGEEETLALSAEQESREK